MTVRVVRVAIRSLALVAAVSSGVACKEEPAPAASAPRAGGDDQTFEEALHIVCDAPDQAEAPPESAGAANRMLALAAWTDQRVKNREARQLMGSLAARDGDGKIAALESGARRAGIARCAMAELWRSLGSGPAR